MRNLTATEKDIAKKAIQRNAFPAHPENLLLCMLADENSTIRRKAVTIVQKIRIQAASNGCSTDDSDEDEKIVVGYSETEESDTDEVMAVDESIRLFAVPKLKFQAKTYDNMINWKAETLTEPPLTLKLTNDEILNIIDKPLDAKNYPCHSQSVERMVKVVSDASAAVYGEQRRDGFIRQRVKSRKLMSKINSKKDFNTHFV